MLDSKTANAAIDSAWIGTGGLALFGYSLETYILVFAFLFGAARAVQALFELYWKMKDRYGKQADS